MNPPYDKKPVNLSVDSELLAQAKTTGVNHSSPLEVALGAEVRRPLGEAWLQDNREAIENYNQHIQTHGSFSDGLRAF